MASLPRHKTRSNYTSIALSPYLLSDNNRFFAKHQHQDANTVPLNYKARKKGEEKRRVAWQSNHFESVGYDQSKNTQSKRSIKAMTRRERRKEQFFNAIL